MPEKSILLIRHGQSIFNAAHLGGGPDPMLFDAPLSELGRQQVATAREALRATPVDLVLASPLTRALQTAQGIFEGHPSAPPLLVEALHRERVEHSGDVGSNPADLARAFPALAFDHLPPVWWHAEGTPVAPRIYVEPIESVADRVGSFRELLRARPERSIAVVGHGTFLYLLTGHIFDNCEIVAFDLDAPLPATP